MTQNERKAGVSLTVASVVYTLTLTASLAITALALVQASGVLS